MPLLPSKIPEIRHDNITDNAVPPVKVVSQDKNLQNIGADIRDPQVIFSFNKKAITSVFGPNYIMVNNIVDLNNANEEDYKEGVITTFSPTTLVNFTYSLFNNDSLEGMLRIVDNNNTFENFLSQSLLSETRLTFYFSWGYGTNRYHWSSLHKGIITNLTYNIHEGYKVVDIQFIANPRLDSEAMMSPQFDLVNIFDVRKKGSKFVRSFTGQLEIKTDKFEKSIGAVIEELIEKAAEDAYNKGNPFSERIEVVIPPIDWNKIAYVQELEKIKRKVVTYTNLALRPKDYSSLPRDLAYLKLTKDMGCFSYSTGTISSVTLGEYAPGGNRYIQNVILNKGDVHQIELSVRLPREKVEALRRYRLAITLARIDLENYAKEKKFPTGFDLSKPPNMKGPFDVKPEPRVEAIVKRIEDLEKRIKSLSVNQEDIFVDEKFPALIYKKPKGVPAIPYFKKFLRALNLRLGTNLNPVFDDTREIPTLFIGNNIKDFNPNSKSALRSNFYANLYGEKTGLRRIKSIATTNTVLEDWDTQVINLSYNDEGSLIEALTVDVQLPEFFKVANRVFEFAAHPLSTGTKKTKYEIPELLKSKKEIEKLFDYYRNDTKRKDKEKVATGSSLFAAYLDTLKAAEAKMNNNKPKSLVVSFSTDFMRGLKDFVKSEKQYIQRFVADKLLSVERKFITVQIKMLGIPELDQIQNLYYGRAVNLSIVDPVDRDTFDHSKPRSWLSGDYFIMGIKHEMTLHEGYSMILNLHKNLKDTPLTSKG